MYCLWPVRRRLSLFCGLNPSLLPHSSERLSLSAAPLSLSLPLSPSLVLLNDEKSSSSFSVGRQIELRASPSLLKMNTFLFKAAAFFLHPSSPWHKGDPQACTTHTHTHYSNFQPPALWFTTTTISGLDCMVLLVDNTDVTLIRS